MSDLETEFKNLLAKFASPGMIHWQPEFRVGPPMFERIRAEVRRGELGANQLTNALIALSAMQRCSTLETVFEIFLEHMSHRSKKVRSTAVGLVLNTMRAENWNASVYNEAVLDRLRSALALGIYRENGRFAMDFLERGPVAISIRGRPLPPK